MEQALKNYREKGIDAHGYFCDVTQEDQVQSMVAQIEEELGTGAQYPGRRHLIKNKLSFLRDIVQTSNLLHCIKCVNCSEN